MSLFGLKGKLEKAIRDQETSSMLQTVWIKIHNVLDVAKEVKTVKEIANLVAEPLVVYEVSLIRARPMRFQGRCRNPVAIHGGLSIFFNGTGVENQKGGQEKAKNHDDYHNQDPDANQKGYKFKRSQSKFDRIGKIDKDQTSTYGDSMEDCLGQKDLNEGEIPMDKVITPIAAFPYMLDCSSHLLVSLKPT
jgi:hypothetical protein